MDELSYSEAKFSREKQLSQSERTTEMRDFPVKAEQVDTAPYHDASQKRRGGISIARDRKGRKTRELKTKVESQE